MRSLAFALIASAFVAMSGCGCLETDASRANWMDGKPDPDQPEWNRCLFGTRRIPSNQLSDPNFFPATPAPPRSTVPSSAI